MHKVLELGNTKEKLFVAVIKITVVQSKFRPIRRTVPGTSKFKDELLEHSESSRDKLGQKKSHSCLLPRIGFTRINSYANGWLTALSLFGFTWRKSQMQ